MGRNDIPASEIKIIQYTWWKDNKQRIWVVVNIWYNGDKPISIDMLQFASGELVSQPYDKIKGYAESGAFIPYIN